MNDKIDLHGLTKLEAIEALVKFYNSRVKKGNLTPFEVIHGYGSSGVGGVLLTRIRGFLSEYSELLDFDGGTFLNNNPGVTRIFPKKPLPDVFDMLGEEILDYCTVPKTISKITGKFHRYEESKILASIKNLEKQKRLRSFHKASFKVYQTI